MKLASLLGRVGLDRVGQSGSSKEEEKHQERGETDTPKKREQRIEGADGAV